jgi:hypothetical protein
VTAASLTLNRRRAPLRSVYNHKGFRARASLRRSGALVGGAGRREGGGVCHNYFEWVLKFGTPGASAHSISFFRYRRRPGLAADSSVGRIGSLSFIAAAASCCVTARVSLPTRPRHNPLKKRLTSRSFLLVVLRRRLLSGVQRPCLKLPLRAPDGPPEPFAIRQRARPRTAACRQGRPVRVLAPQRGALAILASRRAMSA